MSKIVGNVLYPLEGNSEPVFVDYEGNLGQEVIKSFESVLEQNGDFDWIINGPYDLTGQTSTCGLKRRKISEFAPNARKVGKALYRHGLRKGDVVHLVIPNSTENHIIATGIWLCEAVASLGKS